VCHCDVGVGVEVGEAAVEAEVDCLLELLRVGGVLNSGEVRVVGPLVTEPRGVSAREGLRGRRSRSRRSGRRRRRPFLREYVGVWNGGEVRCRVICQLELMLGK